MRAQGWSKEGLTNFPGGSRKTFPRLSLYLPVVTTWGWAYDPALPGTRTKTFILLPGKRTVLSLSLSLSVTTLLCGYMFSFLSVV